VPGIVDEERGSVISAPALGWNDVSLGSTIQANVGLPVYVEKSANAAVTGEEFFGVARQSSHVVYVLLDAFLSSGLYLNGSLYRGFDGTAGELEPLDRDLVGQVAAALEAGGLARSVAGLGQAAASGQPDVLRLIAYLATTVARRIHALSRLLNPELIVVGGRFSAIGEALLSLIRDALTEMDERSSVRLELTALGVHGVSTGAATLAVKSFLANLRRTR
jgi:predicted NBD/HSP70 family sugar kinase